MGRVANKTAWSLMLVSLGLPACGGGQSASPPPQTTETQTTTLSADAPPAQPDPQETARAIARWYAAASKGSREFLPLQRVSVVTDTATLYFDDFNYERANRAVCSVLLKQGFVGVEHVRIVEGRAQLQRIGAECP